MAKYTCSICGYVYDEAKGIPEAGIVAGTKWEELPDDWVCPLVAQQNQSLKEGESAPTELRKDNGK